MHDHITEVGWIFPPSTMSFLKELELRSKFSAPLVLPIYGSVHGLSYYLRFSYLRKCARSGLLSIFSVRSYRISIAVEPCFKWFSLSIDRQTLHHGKNLRVEQFVRNTSPL
jgi:hypothetical protein